MTSLRIAAMVLAALSIIGATAKSEWKTLTLRGEPGLTISIPAAADNTIDEKNPNDLMFFSVEANLHGSMFCIAQRAAYPAGIARATFAAALATERREVFCQNDRKTVSDVSVGSSESFERGGSQGAICTASYTDTADESPGHVQSQLIIAAPQQVYFLTCNLEEADQDVAEFEWSLFWGDKVRHIQDSFQVPN